MALNGPKWPLDSGLISTNCIMLVWTGNYWPVRAITGDTGWRTGGVDQRVRRASVTGQVTSPVHVSYGAAQSEPHGCLPAPSMQCCCMTVVRERVVPGMVYPGWWGQGRPRIRALHRGGRVHIRRARKGHMAGQARAGTGQNSG